MLPTKVETLKHITGEFVDPENVNSTVRVSLETTLWSNGTTDMDGTVSFGDCNRVISWDNYGGRYDVLLKKVDRAIEVLKKARNAMLTHEVVADRFKADYAKAKMSKSGKAKAKKRTKKGKKR